MVPANDPKSSFKWCDAFLLGFSPMDDTHREFVEHVFSLQCATDDGLLDTLRALKSHCEAHFGQEERWMEDTEMPARDCHADEHAAVLRSVNQVLDLVNAQPGGEHSAVVRSLADALADWFPGHADYMDSALSHWMNKRRFGGKPVVLRRQGADSSSSLR